MYLSGKKLEELSYFRKLSTIGQSLGLELVIFTPDDVGSQGVRALVYDTKGKRWVRKRVPLPSLIYDRCRYHGISNYRKISAFRRKHTHLNYITRPLANKWKMHQVLSENEKVAPHLPHTVKYQDSKQLSRMLEQHATLYLKPKSGTGGRGIIRLQRDGGGKTVLMQGRDPGRRIISPAKLDVAQVPIRLNGWKLHEKYIVQQGISLKLKDGRVHDYRMLVQKDGNGDWKVTGCAGRIGPPASVTSNLHGGGKAVPMEQLLLARFKDRGKSEQIRQTAYTLGLNIAAQVENSFGEQCEIGIDLAVDGKGRVWLLEVNPKPSREIFWRTGQRGIYRTAISRPLEYALKLLRSKPAKQSADSN